MNEKKSVGAFIALVVLVVVGLTAIFFVVRNGIRPAEDPTQLAETDDPVDEITPPTDGGADTDSTENTDLPAVVTPPENSGEYVINADVVEPEPTPDQWEECYLPNITLVDTQGNEVNIRDYNGTPVLLLYVMDHTDACEASLSYYNSYYRQVGSLIKFFVVFHLSEGQSYDDIIQYAGEQGYTFPIYFDPEFAIVDEYDIQKAPQFILLDDYGKEYYRTNDTVEEGDFFRKIGEVS